VSERPAGERDEPRVSVIVAAYDLGRWALLERALSSALAQSPRPQVVLAVDNNAELFARASEEFPGVEVVLNARGRGASTTRNTGAAAAGGDYLAFLDDDAEATPGWLAGLVAPLLADPSVIGVGGGVEPSWPEEAPRWFPMEFAWVVGASYTGMPTTGAPVRNVWSENMAVRASEFHGIGGFREGFGKVGESSRPEDTEFCLRLQAAHPRGRWWYEPAALIRHHVPAERATVAFFLRRCLAEGRGKAALAEHVGRHDALETERSYVARTLTAGAARGLSLALRGDVTGLARSAAILAGGGLAAGGYVLEAARSRRAARPTAAGAE